MRVVVAVLVLLWSLAAVPGARADTIVFRRGTDVWRMAPDGGGQTRMTWGPQRLEWPSAADDGTVVAADELGQLWRFSLDGIGGVGGPVPTAATDAEDDVSAETPTHVRIAPDGARIAYDELIEGDATTLWTPAQATGLDLPRQDVGQAGLVAPSWIGASTLLLSRDVASADPGPTFSLYTVGEGDASAEPWFSDPSATWATGFDAAASRSGTRIAVLENDAADHDGTPTRAVLRLFTAAAPGEDPVFRCQLAVEAADTVGSASPTFAPDGSRLAWAESDGVHVATLGALSDCGAIRERVVTLPGAWEPYWTPATSTAAPSTPAAAPRRALTLAVSTRARPHRLTLRRRGLRVRVTSSAPTTVRLSVRVTGTTRFAARAVRRRLTHAGTTTITLHLRARTVTHARRLTVRASAPRARPVRTTLHPRP